MYLSNQDRAMIERTLLNLVNASTNDTIQEITSMTDFELESAINQWFNGGVQ